MANFSIAAAVNGLIRHGYSILFDSKGCHVISNARYSAVSEFPIDEDIERKLSDILYDVVRNL